MSAILHALRTTCTGVRFRNLHSSVNKCLQHHVERATSATCRRMLVIGHRAVASRFVGYSMICIGSVSVHAASSPAEAVKVSPAELKQITKKADELFGKSRLEDLCELLRPYKGTDQIELIWRMSRAAYNLSKTPGLSKDKHKALIEESYEMAKRSLELDNNSAVAHKWMSVTLDAFSTLQGFRSRCQSIAPVRDHMLRSIELDPSDATVMYMLGMLYYSIADLTWYQRSILQAIGGKPPTATFEEALTYFKKAEETSPNFYSLNLLLLGKCYLQLGDKDLAVAYLTRAASYPKHTDDDHQAHKEASELLKKLKINL